MTGTATGVHEVRWCFHTTAMVTDYERTRDALVRIAGLRVLEDSRIEEPAIGRRGGMAWLGDNILEIGEPIVEGGAADRFVRRFGSHMSTIAVQVSDIAATSAFLREHGARLASEIDHGEHRIVFTHPSDTAGIVIEWFGSEEPMDPRFGGPIPAMASDPILDVEQMAFGGAVVDDPISAAERLATLFGRDVTFTDPAAPAGVPKAGVSMGDMTLALYAVPPTEESESLWGYTYTRPQTCNVGVRVPHLGPAIAALRDAGIEILRAEDRAAVIPPRATGGVTVVVVEELLPGDPRS